MIGYDRSERTIDEQRWICDWIDEASGLAVPPPTEDITHTPTVTNKTSRPRSSSIQEIGHPPKRSKTNHLPTPPPGSMSDASGRRKRQSDVVDDDIFITPKAKVTTYKRPRSNSPKKRSQPSSKLNLSILEKPIYEEALRADNLPPDVAHLRAQLADQWRSGTTISDTDKRLDVLRDIVADAAEASKYLAHESSWNNLVHTPLLRLIFKTTKLLPSEEEPLRQQGSFARARLVPAMTATISGEYIPRKKRPQPPRRPTDTTSGSVSVSDSVDSASLACSVSVDESVASALEDPDVVEIHSRSHSKKVDYVLVIDAPVHTQLGEWLQYIAIAETFDTDRLAHINQTRYGPLTTAPIACSIETKSESARTGGLTQLGLWVAAWHKKMHAIQDFLSTDLARRPNVHDRIPSSLLIQVVDHDWTLFFACDNASAITLHGPMKIGSTTSLEEARALVASLEVIKAWMETTFREKMQSWVVW